VAPGFYFGDRYDRFQEPVILTGSTARLTVTTRNIASGGARIPFGFALPLTLTFDGRAVATATTVTEASSVSFDVQLANLSGWYRTSVTGAPAAAAARVPVLRRLPARDKLVMTQLAICRQDDKHRPVRKGRVLCTANRQDYSGRT
jgi:hypothetical protein